MASFVFAFLFGLSLVSYLIMSNEFALSALGDSVSSDFKLSNTFWLGLAIDCFI